MDIDLTMRGETHDDAQVGSKGAAFNEIVVYERDRLEWRVRIAQLFQELNLFRFAFVVQIGGFCREYLSS